MSNPSTVTDPRVANELGVAIMSVYRYVSAKEDLLLMMVDTGLGDPPDPVPGESWREGLTRWVQAVRSAYQRHPWSLRVPIGGAPLGPNNVAYLESALTSLNRVDLSEQEKISTVILLSGFVRNETTLNADILAASASGAQPATGYGEMLSVLTTEDDFPALHRTIESGAFDDDDDLDQEFDFGLACILDGVEALMKRNRKHRRPPTSARSRLT